MRGAQSGPFTIPANSRITVQGQGQFIRCLEANGVFTVSVNNGQEIYFASGISYTSPDFEDYTEFALINRTAAPVTVIIAWGFGTVTDNRLTATGNLFVINAPATTLKVDDDETQAAVSLAGANIVAMMQNNQDQRKPVNSLVGFTYAQAVNATVTPISAVANVNGCLIALAYCANNGGISRIQTSGNLLLFAGGNQQDKIENILIPAGKDVTLYSSYTDNYACIYYKLL